MAFLQGLNQIANSFAALGGPNLPIPGGGLNPPTATERAARSVFVGNIPYDATDEQLKEIFSQVGQVVSFRLVYDRETGKPKGYGFCEYADPETAQSAMRNLNNHDFNGRPLRVGYAAGESKEDMKAMNQAVGGMAIESPYGEPVEPEKAPEAISRAVASLPPEQMFELMKQMKLCIQNNPNEARNMLLQNPQLAYALLQAQIVMKIVDPQVAMAMLYRDDTQPLANVPAQQPPGAPLARTVPMSIPASIPISSPMSLPMSLPMSAPMPAPGGPQGRMGFPGAPIMSQPMTTPMIPQSSSQMPMPPAPPEMARDPRLAIGSRQPPMQPAPGGSGAGPAGQDISAQDQEKAALIMQVLQLTDQQIAMLPPEQRQSILILKEQLTKSQ